MIIYRMAKFPKCNTSATSKASKGQWWKFELRKTSTTSKAKWWNFELLADPLFWHPKYDHCHQAKFNMYCVAEIMFQFCCWIPGFISNALDRYEVNCIIYIFSDKSSRKWCSLKVWRVILYDKIHCEMNTTGNQAPIPFSAKWVIVNHKYYFFLGNNKTNRLALKFKSN